MKIRNDIRMVRRDRLALKEMNHKFFVSWTKPKTGWEISGGVAHVKELLWIKFDKFTRVFIEAGDGYIVFERESKRLRVDFNS